MTYKLTGTERTLRASIAANSRWARPGAREAHAEKIRAARIAHYEAVVDPESTLPPAERARLALNAMRADMQRLALRSSRARRRDHDDA